MANTNKLDNLGKILNEYNERLTQLRQDLMKKYEKEIQGIFMDVFETYPDIEKIGWTQYTPYFNDGDPCEFSVHEVTYKRFEDQFEDDDNVDEWNYMYSEDREKYPGLEKLNKILQNSEEFLCMMFGDHVMVVATRDGLEASEYDHE